MELTDTQKQAVARWVKEGCALSEIQKRLAQEFQLTLTYMDVRFLVLDLGLELKETAKPPARPPDLAAPDGVAPGGQTPFGASPAKPAEGVRVELDRVTRPGAIVSGTVTFSDGVKASWALDQLGRLSLDTGRRKYRPSEADVQAFQETLSQELQKHGY